MAQMGKVAKWIIVALAVVAIAILAVIAAQSLLARDPSDVVVKSSSPTITQLQELGELTVLRVNLTDVMENENKDYKGIYRIQGVGLISVDMALAELQSKNEETKSAVLRLPQPRVLEAKVDLSNAPEYDVSKKSWIPWTGDRSKFTNDSLAKAQEMVESACSGEETMAQARDSAEAQVANMYRFVGWSVEVVWKD